MSIRVLRGTERFVTPARGRETRHAFSFGVHHDPARLGFGSLVACNEDRLDPAAGYGRHPHRGVEIVTWVLAGSLHHDDDHGHRGELGPGTVQVLSAGSGVQHAERAGPAGPVHLLQMWLADDGSGAAPAYASRDLTADLDRGGWVLAVSGHPRDAGTALRVRQPAARLLVARLGDGERLTIPPAVDAYVHVAAGVVDLAGVWLAAGDAWLRTGGARERLAAVGPAEVLVWELDGSSRR